MLQTETDYATKRELCFVISNICQHGNEADVISLCLNNNLINCLANIL